jgi:hypothetical protein
MARAVLGEGLEPFTRLADGFPQEADRASLAYAQSYYFISYLLNTHGEQVLTRLVTELVKGRELSDAMRRATGRGLARVEQEFREAMEDRFSWLALLTAGGVVWALVALVAGVGLVLRRRAHRLRLSAWPDQSQTAREDPLAGRHWPPPPRRGGVLAEAGQETAPDGASRQSKKANSGERAITSAQDE